jgi:transcriptional regulator with XRE-family HTH domain
MKPREWFEKHLKMYANDPEYELEGIILEITEQISKELEKQKLTRTELARRLGVSNAYVSKVLNGMPNLTLAKMVEISKAIGSKLKVEFIPGKRASAMLLIDRIPSGLADLRRYDEPTFRRKGIELPLKGASAEGEVEKFEKRTPHRR